MVRLQESHIYIIMAWEERYEQVVVGVEDV